MPVDPRPQLARRRHRRAIEQSDYPRIGADFGEDIVEHQSLTGVETIGIRQDQLIGDTISIGQDQLVGGNTIGIG